MESDDATGTGSRASGLIRLQDTTSFDLSKLRSNYALGVDGWDTGYGFPGHFAMAASCRVNNGSNSNGIADVNDVAYIYVKWTIGRCSIGSISASTGRATAGFGTPVGSNFILYMINEDDFFVISPSIPMYSGRVISTADSFSLTSVSGNYVFRSTGGGSNVINGQISGGAALGVMDFANGNITASGYTYFDSTLSNQLGGDWGPTYSVDSASGRVSLGPFTYDAIYITTTIDGISGFYIDFGASAPFGVVETQPTVTFSTASSAGNYIVVQDEPTQPSFTNLAGDVSINSTGSASGTSDASSPSGLLPNQPFSLNLTVNADGTGNVGPNSFAVANGTKVFILQESGDDGHITVLEPR